MVLGDDPATGQPVSLRTGPYGPYLQLGEAEGKAKPKRVALPKVSPRCLACNTCRYSGRPAWTPDENFEYSCPEGAKIVHFACLSILRSCFLDVG